MKINILHIIKFLLILKCVYFINSEQVPFHQSHTRPQLIINQFLMSYKDGKNLSEIENQNEPKKDLKIVNDTMDEELNILKQLEQKIDFINERVIKLEKENKLIEYKLKELKCYSNIATRGCHHLKGCESGVYNIINPQISNNSFLVSCDLETLGGGWTIIQRRQDGSENFYRNWSEYTIGFGNITNEFFMGLNKLHALTSLADPQELYIILEDFKGDKKYARYGIFKIDSESTDYTLTVDDYSGNAGDSLLFHNGSKFSTNDRDNDIYSGNCAESFKGSWWYKNCYYSNLNGKYYKNTTSRFDGVNWRTFRNFDSLKFVQMMIRPKEN